MLREMIRKCSERGGPLATSKERMQQHCRVGVLGKQRHRHRQFLRVGYVVRVPKHEYVSTRRNGAPVAVAAGGVVPRALHHHQFRPPRGGRRPLLQLHRVVPLVPVGDHDHLVRPPGLVGEGLQQRVHVLDVGAVGGDDHGQGAGRRERGVGGGGPQGSGRMEVDSCGCAGELGRVAGRRGEGGTCGPCSLLVRLWGGGGSRRFERRERRCPRAPLG